MTGTSRIGWAQWRCNKCARVVKRNLGWQLWTVSFCEEAGKRARLYRVSAPKQWDRHCDEETK